MNRRLGRAPSSWLLHTFVSMSRVALAQDAGAPAPEPDPAASARAATGATLAPSFVPAPPSDELEPSLDPDADLAEVTVRVARGEAKRLQESAEAVNVVDTRKAQKQTADLGEVLAHTQGIAIRRDGGLGSEARFSLNGLYDDQMRFFLDGVPLEAAGFPFGIANVPVT